MLPFDVARKSSPAPSRRTMPILHGLPPIENPSARALVLGSMPGGASLRHGRYYAHPQNLFWTLMGRFVGASPALPYAQRIERIREAGIALWDVIARCEREGSLDSAIRGAELRDLSAFVDRLPALEAVAFNGKTAALHGRRQIGARPGLALIDLPSSSGAFASMSREAKRNAWMAMMPYVSGA